MREKRAERFFISLIGLLLLLTIIPLNGHSAVPQTINYQGYLTDPGGTPVDGTVQMTFSIYDVDTGGTALWSETQSVSVSNGIYSVNLGEVTPINLDFDTQYYLGVKVETDAEMTPRQPLTSVGYSFMAKALEGGPVAAIPAGGIIMWSGSIASIPSGWALCDGTNGTPDLRDRFIVGAGSTYSPGDTGGATNHTHGAGSYAGQSHTHAGTSHTHGVNAVTGYTQDWYNPTSGTTYLTHPNRWDVNPPIDHKHSFSVTTGSGGSGSTSSAGGGAISGTSASANTLPPYYALAYIMKL